MRVVQKYGGSSLAAVRLIRDLAGRIAKAQGEQPRELVVVVSAMGDETDALCDLALRANPQPRARELDLLLSCGEQKAVALMTMALQARGLDAVGLTGGQAGLITDAVHGLARLRDVDTARIERELRARRIVVVAGFQGSTTGREITTLGRGGSELTAVALAAALGADACEVYLAVDGVYEADPAVVPGARRLARIDYDEMLELASNGNPVLLPRSIEYAHKHGVRIEVRGVGSDGPGTVICGEDESMERPVYRGIAVDPTEVMLSIRGVPDRPGVAAGLFSLLAARGVVVDMITQSAPRGGLNDIACTFRADHLAAIQDVLGDLVRQSGAADAEVNERVAKISIIGIGMRSARGVAATMFQALADAGINIHLISTSEIRVSCVIDDDAADEAARAVHRAFEVSPEVAIQE